MGSQSQDTTEQLSMHRHTPMNSILSKSKVKIVERCHFSHKKEVHVHARAMKEDLCHFSGSVYELNALIFPFKKLALHTTKMNDKMHANDLNF